MFGAVSVRADLSCRVSSKSEEDGSLGDDRLKFPKIPDSVQK